MKMKKMFWLMAVASVLTACGGKGERPSFGDNEYPVTTVATSSATMKTTYPATINGIQDVEIRPKATGFLVKTCVTEGQQVSAGQLLFVIDNETAQAAVRQAQAAVTSAQTQVNTAKLTYDNSKQLRESNIIGDYELQTSENSYRTAQASLAQAQASLASAKEALNFCYVKSPSNGVVGTLPFKNGALVSGSNVLTHVSDISKMEVVFSLTEKDVLAMSQGEGGLRGQLDAFPPLKLQLADGSIYQHEGKVVSASGVVDAATGSVQLQAHFPNPERLLKSGGSGAIIVPKNAEQAIIIPQNVVSEVQDKKFVFVLGKDNKVKYTEITVDPQNDGRNYIVTSGLNVGDKYVTNGITKLQDQMEIVPITPQRYEQKIKEGAEAMKKQGTAKGFIDAMK